MGRNLNPKCKQCRRVGEKLFLKGDRCFSSKCAIVQKNYPPGVHGVKGSGRLTGFGQQLREKQKAKRTYRLLEDQFKNYFRKAMRKKGDTGEILLQLLEMRLDNIVYRLGFASSRDKARQLVGHGHFLVNDKKVNIPSYQMKVGDTISIKEKSKQSEIFKDLAKDLEKKEMSDWLVLDAKDLKGKITGLPSLEEVKQNINVKLIVEYYSR